MKDLLLLLCRYPFDESNRKALSQLIGEVGDWPAMVRLINAHGIIALAAYNIKESGLEKLIPADVMAVIENGYLRNIVRNTWLTGCWKEVNTILGNAGIKHILLKGMALEHTIYGSRGLRQMNDNDILINPGDSFRAWQLLQKQGYTPEPLKSPLFRKIRFEFGRHLPALYKNGYALEIHDNLFESVVPDVKNSVDPFKDAIKISIGDTEAHILPPELQLMHLIDHFEHHAMAGECQLRLYTDIKLLDPDTSLEIPESFIYDPIQSNKPGFRKVAYKTLLRSIPPGHRLRFIIGDTFPSLKWMMKRYKCSAVKAILWYPFRMGKWRWLA